MGRRLKNKKNKERQLLREVEELSNSNAKASGLTDNTDSSQKKDKPVAPQFSMKMFVIPLGMLIWNRLGIEIKEGSIEMFYMRLLFIGLSCLSLLMGLFFYISIKKFEQTDEGRTLIECETRNMSGEYERRRITNASHDRIELMTYFRTLIIASLFSYFIHYKWGAVQPLLAQILMQPFNCISHKLFDIYVLGKELKRPFPKEKDFLEQLVKPNRRDLIKEQESKKNS